MGDITVFGEKEDLPGIVRQMVLDLNEHGEVHAVIEDVDGEVELRLGATHVDAEYGVIEVYDGTNHVVFDAGRVISYYKPTGIYHE